MYGNPNSVIWFGRFEGKKLKDIPTGYLYVLLINYDPDGTLREDIKTALSIEVGAGLNRIMPYGKYKGEKLKDINKGYLNYVLVSHDIDPKLYDDIVEALCELTGENRYTVLNHANRYY